MKPNRKFYELIIFSQIRVLYLQSKWFYLGLQNKWIMASSNIGQECFKLLKNTFKFNDYKSGLQAQAVKKIAAGMYLTSDIWG